MYELNQVLETVARFRQDSDSFHFRDRTTRTSEVDPLSI
jgi:hypothetical protein